MEKSILDLRKLKGQNNNHLSKSIVIHHSKNANLFQSFGRYADLINKDNEDEYGKINQINEVISDEDNEYENTGQNKTMDGATSFKGYSYSNFKHPSKEMGNSDT